MPPSTRREVRLSASLPNPTAQDGASRAIDTSRSGALFMPNMESILENFELFKRKHITQNREIIKANAVAQLRIRELENRVQVLEAEKVQKELAASGLTAQVSNLRHAIGCIHAGWEAIGRGLTLAVSDSQRDFVPPFPPEGVQLPPSNRVKVEPNPNAAAVVRPVATAPEAHIGCLQEEGKPRDGPEHLRSSFAASDVRSTLLSSSESYPDDWQRHFEALRDGHSKGAGESLLFEEQAGTVSSLDMDGAPSPMGSPELPMGLEDAFAAATSRSASHQWSLPEVDAPLFSSTMASNIDPAAMEDNIPYHNATRHPLRRSGRKSSRRQSGYHSQPGFLDGQSHCRTPEPGSPTSSQAPTSDAYLPSETDSEAMQGVLVYRGGDEAPLARSHPRKYTSEPLTEITNEAYPSSSSLYDHSALHLGGNAHLADATPCKPQNITAEPASMSSTAHTNTSSHAAASEALTPGGRKRKIPNHEGHDPMPTPARLFNTQVETTPSAPATALADAEPQSGRTRRVRKSINYALPKLNTKMRKPDPSDLVPAPTPHRSAGTTPSSARGMVGSTGNLSDIRKLHEAAAWRQSPAERTSNMRSKGSPTRAMGDGSKGDDDSGARMADLFEIRQHADHLAHQNSTANTRSFWSTEGVGDTSDDDSRVTSNADLGELAELEAAMTELCTTNEVHQVDTPRAPQPSMWPSRSGSQMAASSSTESVASHPSSATSKDATSKRPSLRRKTTTLPSRSRQSSAEQAMQSDAATNAGNTVESDANGHSAQNNCGSASLSSHLNVSTAPCAEPTKTSVSAQAKSDPRKASERIRPSLAASTSVDLGKSRPSSVSGGLAAGMRPKQRPASAGAALLGSRSASASSSGSERPRTFSGITAAGAGLTQSAGSGVAAGSVGRSSTSVSAQRASLHSALTNQTKTTSGQVTPRVGTRGLPTSTTPASKDSPQLAGTPILRPTLSTSSLASESSGRSSPALSAASTGSSGTQLSTTTRASLKTTSTTAQHSKTQRPGTAGSTASGLASSREGSTPRLTASSVGTSAAATRPQPARSMPSLRRATEKAGVTSTPRITVRSSSSTLPAAAAGANGTSTSSPATTIAASKVAKAISSTSANRVKDASSTPTGLGIDFSSMLDEGSAGKELINLTDEIHQVLQSSASSAEPSSSLSSQTNSSPSTSASKVSSDDTTTSAASLPNTRRTSRRISGLTA